VTDSDLASFEKSLDEMVHSTDRLLETVDRFSNDDLRAPSLLPGWTRGHVLTHIARNADGLANLAQGARDGEQRDMYAGGREGRAAAIEEGAARHIGDIRLDVADSAERLLSGFADFPAEALERELSSVTGASWLAWELPLMRIREVEIHHVDLGAGYLPQSWTPEFVSRTLDQLAPQFLGRGDMPVATLRADGGGTWQVGSEGPELSGQPAALLAWLTGRTPGEPLRCQPAGEVPAAPRWG
jgi:maleylpyruvate isomerase